jgi:antitoxin HicB
VYHAWKEAKVSKTELARRLGRNEIEVRRILNPRHGTKLDQLEEAAKALGGRLTVAFEQA